MSIFRTYFSNRYSPFTTIIIKINANVHLYEPLRDQGAFWLSYHEVTKRTDLRNPLPAMAYMCY